MKDTCHFVTNVTMNKIVWEQQRIQCGDKKARRPVKCIDMKTLQPFFPQEGKLSTRFKLSSQTQGLSTLQRSVELLQKNGLTSSAFHHSGK